MVKLNIPTHKELMMAIQSSQPSMPVKLPPGVMAGESLIQSVPIPPLNTIISFTDARPYKRTQAVSIFLQAQTPLPKIWDWRHPYPIDSSETKSRKKQISLPGDQKLCGSCWAISTASLVNDNFVAEGLVSTNPNLSTTYSLACYPQKQCLGGDPSILISDISENGVATNHCVDYSWCTSDGQCSGKAVDHLNKDSHAIEVADNDIIPECGCYYGKDKDLYYISKPETINDTTSDSPIQDIKRHIYVHGPVLGGFIVYSNFKNGGPSSFAKSKGVYLENVDYTSSDEYFLPDQPTVLGGHAIAIVGWGEQSGVTYLDDNNNKKVGTVPYWYCRNSWTPKWGTDGGYFKIAMYPYNSVVQFSKQLIQNGQLISRGALVFTAERVDRGNLNTIQKPDYDLENDNSFYKDEGLKSGPSPDPSPDPSPSSGSDSKKSLWDSIKALFNSKNSFAIVAILILIVLMIL
jgi:hypothetical protein